MTPGRRSISYDTFDQVMPDVERLLEGHTTVGQWTLAQICRHLANTLRRIIDLPASTPQDPTGWNMEAKKRILELGIVPEGLPSSQTVVPTDLKDASTEAAGLREAIAYYRAAPGPVIAHPRFGPLSRVEWDRFNLVHMAHHLSFAVPAEGEHSAR